MVTKFLLLILFPAAVLSLHKERCFPEDWHGSWFHVSVPDAVDITYSTMSHRGDCVGRKHAKFLLKDKEENCYRCMVIHQQHINILQYKETFCMPYEPLALLCARLRGDAQLHSMFRREVPPIPCPLRPPFTFTYSRGGRGECMNPVSRVEACTEDYRLLLRYQACPDVDGSQASDEILTCLAEWKEAGTRYLVGKLSHRMATSDSDRYRCFVWTGGKGRRRGGEKHILMAQSGEATCSGLLSPTDGARTMKLTRVSHFEHKCRFPNWVRSHSSWYTLDMKQRYHFNHGNKSLRIENYATGQITKVLCNQQLMLNETYAQYIIHTMSGCENGYLCMVFHRRDKYITEVKTGGLSYSAEYACTKLYFEESRTEPTTLISSMVTSRQCPLMGQWAVTEGGMEPNQCPDGDKMTTIISGGCSLLDTIHLRSPCRPSPSAHRCHGYWQDDERHFMVTSELASSNTNKLCWMYTTLNGSTTLEVTSGAHGCPRRTTPAVFNITWQGPCEIPAAMSDNSGCSTVPMSFLLTNLLVILVTLFTS